jgi:hypothetical protein
MVYRRFARKLIGLLAVAALCASVVIAPVGAETIAPVTVTPSTTSAGAVNVEYKFAFKLPTYPGISSSEDLTVTFPAGYDLSNVSAGTVTFSGTIGWSGTVYAASRSGQSVKIRSTPGFQQNWPILLTFLSTSQISNPSVPSTYTFSVSTPLDSGSGSVVIGTGGGGGGGTGVGGVTSVSATASPSNAGKPAEYVIGFVTGSDAPLIGGTDYVDIQFPAGSTVPATIASGSVVMNISAVTSIQVTGTRIRLGVPSDRFILGGNICNIIVTAQAGVTHPELPGTYTIQVATSKQPNYSSSNQYLVVGTAVSSATLAVEPVRQGMAAQIQVTMTTSTTGSLTAREGRIYLEFPTSMTVPASVPASAVRVDGIVATTVQMTSVTRMAVTVPQNVGANAVVRLAISVDAGVRNPSATGSFQLVVSTSQDTTPVTMSYTVTASQITAPVVQVSTGAAGQAAAYTLIFTTGPGGALTAGIDRVNCEFPAGTTIPVAILSNTATVNGAPSTLVTSTGMIVSVTVPASVAANSQVTLVFSEGAGIRNPVTGGTYTLRVSTSRETSAIVSSGYAVSVVPTVLATVVPDVPNGTGGYYRTRPAIAFTAQSAIDPQPVISYSIDGGAETAYGGQPIAALEGSHTYTFVAVDRLANRSATGTLTIAVDTVPPVIAVSSPRDGDTVNGTSIVVQGTVDVGSTLTVNGQAATVEATGAFAAPVTILGASASILIEATDPAGNSAQQTVRVSVDKTPPTLTVSQPVNFEKIQRLPIVVRGRTEAGASVTVQDLAIPVLTDGSFEVSLTSVADGPLTISVVARDAAGNATTRTVAVTVTSTKLIQMQIGATTALMNGAVVTLQTAPIIKNSTTLVPLRFIAETFGITPVWDGVFQLIDLALGSSSIRLQIGQRFASVDGRRIVLDAAPIIQGGVTLVPLRFIAETLGAETRWEASTRTIIIVYPRS